MLDINSATARIARQIQSTEQAVANALVETTALAHSAAVALRDVGGAPQAAAHGILQRMNSTISDLISASGNSARVHGQLKLISREMGATEEPSCPEMPFKTAELHGDRQIA